ncbi:Hypothetical protein, putative [Bodo saltans]|uniref:Uncharacterized protein n=1 Tax=Bodo saltans TaxID=75058 RepID=A0A0S4JWK8_BODSA|nr:Hypothetical protein, putative [Bodo saltans]|eukprot:CUG93516.1 Hypothetical protein, putative [Bodo saltans]
MRRSGLLRQLNLSRPGTKGTAASDDAFFRVSERPLNDADYVYSALCPVHTTFLSRVPRNMARRRRERALENVQFQMARNNLGVKY